MLLSMPRLRKSALALSILALVANSLIAAAPANAVTTVSVTHNCSISGTFTVDHVDDNGYLYTDVSSNSACAGVAVIPDGVTSIGWGAFQSSALLTSVVVPESVTSIGAYAFSSTSALTTVTFEGVSTLETIGVRAFANASALEHLDFPPSVISIEERAFQQTALTSVILPERLTQIGFAAFWQARALTTVIFNEYLESIGDYAFSETGLTSANFPRSLATINPGAFADAALLTTVSFPRNSSLMTIGERAFSGTDLRQISIPANVRVIQQSAFKAASSLTRVTFELGSRLKTIGNWAFELTDLTEIIIPVSVSSIGQGVFHDAALLSRITFQRDEPLEDIGVPQDGVSSAAFSNIGLSVPGGATAFVSQDAAGFATTPVNGVQKWLGLNVSRTPNIPCVAPGEPTPGSIKVAGNVAVGNNSCRGTLPIPANIEEFGDDFLRDAGYVTSVSFAAGSQLKRIGESSFRLASALTELTLPEGLFEIGRNAFWRADAMLSLSLPASLQTIESNAFASVDSLMSITFLGNAPLIVSDSFPVPAGAFAHVTAEATGFSAGNRDIGGSGTVDDPLYFYENNLVIKLAAAPPSETSSYQDTPVVTPPVVLPPVVETEFVATAKVIALSQSVLKASASGVPVLRGAASAKAITFSPYSAKLTTANIRALQKTAASFEGKKGTLVITGFVQYEGRSLALDRKLSLARAKTVAMVLLKYGIDVNVGYSGFGPHNKRAPKSSDRRVEFRWIASN